MISLQNANLSAAVLNHALNAQVAQVVTMSCCTMNSEYPCWATQTQSEDLPMPRTVQCKRHLRESRMVLLRQSEEPKKAITGTEGKNHHSCTQYSSAICTVNQSEWTCSSWNHQSVSPIVEAIQEYNQSEQTKSWDNAQGNPAETISSRLNSNHLSLPLVLVAKKTHNRSILEKTMATIRDQGVGRISNRICQFQERKQQH